MKHPLWLKLAVWAGVPAWGILTTWLVWNGY